MVRRPKAPISFEDIMNISAGGSPEETTLGLALRGHLAVEALLVELIDLCQPGSDPWKWTFPEKTRVLVKHQIIEGDFKSALDSFNNFRNDCAHIFNHQLDMPSAIELAKTMWEAGVDFSDDMPSLEPATIEEWYQDPHGVLTNVLWHLLFDLTALLKDHAGRDLFSSDANSP